MQTDIYQSLGMTSNPFSPATSTKGYFHTQATQRILEEIQFGVLNRRGFMLLIGEVGVGKTSLLLQLLEQMHERGGGALRTAWVFNTLMNRTELLYAIAKDFGLELRADASFTELLPLLNDFFLEVNASGGNCAIIVDEAHNLDGPTLESLRMLSNLEIDEQKLVQIVLSGQPELLSRLDQSEYRQLRSRIAISNVLPPLRKDEIKRYVDFKLTSTKSRLAFPTRALRSLNNATRGNLRLINLVMERALHTMYALNQQQLETQTIRKAIQEVASFQKELRSWSASRRWKRVSVVSMAGLVLLLLTVLLPTLTQQPLLQILGLAPPAPQGVDQAALAQGPSSVRLATEHTVIADGTAFQHDVNAFLVPFDQQDLAPQLTQALQLNSPAFFQSWLPEDLLFFVMEELPSTKNPTYTTFPWHRYTGVGPQWILLWRSPLQFPVYHPDYTGPEIRALQHRLRELNFFDDEPDGYVGSRTWRAITAFQEAHGLKLTGAPNPSTLFWLFSGADGNGAEPSGLTSD